MKVKLLLNYIQKNGRCLVIIMLASMCFISVSCMQNSKNAPAENERANDSTPMVKTTVEVDADPSFVLRRDTVSKLGPRSITRSVIQDRAGNFWLATWEGIVRYDGNEFINYTTKENLIRYHVLSLYEDRSGVIWFGMVGGGIYKYDGNVFTLYRTNDGLADNTIEAFVEDRAGKIWIATGNGLSCFDGNKFVNYSTENGLSSNKVNTLICDKAGKLWIGTNGGINCYDGNSFAKFNMDEGHSFHQVRSLIEDKNGKIYISGQEGLFVFNGNQLTKLSDNYASNLYEGKNGEIWVTSGGETGMTLYKFDGKKMTEIISEKNKDVFFNQIFGLVEDRMGKLWFGTPKGVFSFDGKDLKAFTD
jgi:ligand-binding sensor domain-containing protein